MHFFGGRSVILEHLSWFLTQRTCLWWAPSLGWPLKWSRVCLSQKHVTPTHMAWSVLIFVVWMCCDHVFQSLCFIKWDSLRIKIGWIKFFFILFDILIKSDTKKTYIVTNSIISKCSSFEFWKKSLSLYGKEQQEHFAKYLLLCFIEEKKSIWFWDFIRI